MVKNEIAESYNNKIKFFQKTHYTNCFINIYLKRNKGPKLTANTGPFKG